MSDKSNKYGYVGVDIPEQSFGSNKGVFNPAEINELVADNKWTQYGQLELIETVVADDTVNSYDFDNLGNYNVHFFTANDITSDNTSSQNLDIRVKVGGSVQSSNYQFAQQNTSTKSGGFSESKSTSFGQFIWLPNVDFETNGTANGYAYIYNATDSTKYTFGTFHTVVKQDQHTPKVTFGSNVYKVANVCSGFRVFLATSGNISGGTISLYGIKEYS